MGAGASVVVAAAGLSAAAAGPACRFTPGAPLPRPLPLPRPPPRPPPRGPLPSGVRGVGAKPCGAEKPSSLLVAGVGPCGLRSPEFLPTSHSLPSSLFIFRSAFCSRARLTSSCTFLVLARFSASTCWVFLKAASSACTSLNVECLAWCL